MEGQINMFDFMKSQEPKVDWEHICSLVGYWNKHEALKTEKINQNCEPVVPKWHMSLDHVWCECPKCKTKPDGLTWWHPPIYGISDSGYTEYNTHCPWCGQPMLWDWDEIDRQSTQSADWKWESVKADMTCPGDCIGCSKAKAIGRYLCCMAADGRRVGDDPENGYSKNGHPSWCSRIKKEKE